MKKTTMLEVHVADRDLHATQNLLYRMGVSFTRGSATELIVSHTERLRVESLLKGAFIPHVLQYRFRGCH